MATERRPKEASEILDALHAFSLDTEDEILAMLRDQVRVRLGEEGIDPDSGKSEMKRRIQKIKGQQRLAAARQQRQAHEVTLVQRITNSSLSFDQMRTEVSLRLSQLSPSGSAQVRAYFNRFQNASDDDLSGLLDDLRLLEEMDREGGSDHG